MTGKAAPQVGKVTEAHTPPTRVLVVFAHPAFGKSRVHRALVAAARDVEGVFVNDLYEAYPDYDIDVRREQALLAAHDAIVLQHPLYWYSVPPLLKQWFDLVLEHGWAYGAQGTALAGKTIQTVVSAGGREASYGADSANRHTVAQFLAPVEATARLCRMVWREPVVVHGTHSMTDDDIADAAARYAALLAETVGALTSTAGT